MAHEAMFDEDDWDCDEEEDDDWGCGDEDYSWAVEPWMEDEDGDVHDGPDRR